MSTIASAPKTDYPSLRKPERKHIGVLRDRAKYLEQRLATGEHSTGSASYLIAELEALDWALTVIDEEFAE